MPSVVLSTPSPQRLALQLAINIDLCNVMTYEFHAVEQFTNAIYLYYIVLIKYSVQYMRLQNCNFLIGNTAFMVKSMLSLNVNFMHHGHCPRAIINVMYE